MKKIIIIMLGMLCLATIVYAFTVGNNISQNQLDSLDLDSLDLSNGFLRDEANKVVYNCERINFVKYCYVYGNFTTVEPNYGEGNTIIDYATMYYIAEFPFNPKTYYEIKEKTNLTYTRKVLKQYLQEHYNTADEKNKKKIAKFQTVDSYNIDDIMDGIDLE